VFTTRITRSMAVALIVVPTIAAGQSSVAVSPFVSYVPSATSNPLAGFALTFGGTTGLALRGGAELSINNPEPTGEQGGYRPWGADADAMLFLGGLGGGATVFQRSLSPYVFSGIGMTGGDSSGVNVVRHTWSYGAGALIPLGLHADLFGEARWRMSEYVLPTAKDAPDSKSELRFGLSFHVGGPSRPRSYDPPRRRRSRDYEEDEEYVVRQAPVQQQPQTVVVQAPPPQTVIVQQPAPQPVIIQQEPSRSVNVNLPVVVVNNGSSSRSQRVYVSNSSCSRRYSRSCRQQVQTVQVRTTPSASQTKVVVENRRRKPE
jgi:hypothetical protein